MKQQCIFLILLLTTFSIGAMEQELDISEDGKLHKIRLPFEYLERKPDDKFSPVYECAFTVIDLKKQTNIIPVVWNVRDNVAAFITDGKKLLALNVTEVSCLAIMQELMKKYLDLSEQNADNRFAHTFGTRESSPFGSQESKPSPLHIAATNSIVTQLAVQYNHVFYANYSVNTLLHMSEVNEYTHGVYMHAPFSVAARPDTLFEMRNDKAVPKIIKLYSIDPTKENILMLDNVELDVSKQFLRYSCCFNQETIVQWLLEKKKQKEWLAQGDSIQLRYPQEMPKLPLLARLKLYEGVLHQQQMKYYRQELSKERAEVLQNADKYRCSQPFYELGLREEGQTDQQGDEHLLVATTESEPT